MLITRCPKCNSRLFYENNNYFCVMCGLAFKTFSEAEEKVANIKKTYESTIPVLPCSICHRKTKEYNLRVIEHDQKLGYACPKCREEKERNEQTNSQHTRAN